METDDLGLIKRTAGTSDAASFPRLQAIAIVQNTSSCAFASCPAAHLG